MRKPFRIYREECRPDTMTTYTDSEGVQIITIRVVSYGCNGTTHAKQITREFYSSAEKEEKVFHAQRLGNHNIGKCNGKQCISPPGKKPNESGLFIA